MTETEGSSIPYSTGGDYYGPMAYRPDQIPDQPPQTEDHHRSWLTRRTSIRLPWGHTQEVVPLRIFERDNPTQMRRMEGKADPLGQLQAEGRFQDNRFDHECQRHASPAFRTALLLHAGMIGKFLFFVSTPLTLLAYFFFLFSLSDTNTWQETTWEAAPFMAWMILTPLVAWQGSTLLVVKFPRWSLKEGRGPQWELNRRTGLVTVFEYPKKWLFFRTREPRKTEIPFYEFDAFVTSMVDRQGLPIHFFHFFHRYSDQAANIAAVHNGESSGNPLFAFWDFTQNYMDTSRPLPDIPALEPYRHQDPVTAEHDRRTGRDPNYWRNMDDETWEEAHKEMLSKINRINTRARPNLMARHVDYQV